MEFYAELQTFLRRDDMGRGLAGIAPAPDLAALTESLLAAERAVILTGFPVDCGGAARGETDGPGGAAALARALLALGCEVTVVTDGPALLPVRAAVEILAPGARLECLPRNGAERFGAVLFREFRPTHFITIERPGKGADGHFHNMRGAVIDGMVTDSDFLLPLAERCGCVTIAVGDGGNELGMGALTAEIAACVAGGAQIAAVEKARFTLTAGVSNWWGWGMAALLSRAAGRDLLPTVAEEGQMLFAELAAGGVDGCTRRAELSVDQLPLTVHQRMLYQIRGLVEKGIGREAAERPAGG